MIGWNLVLTFYDGTEKIIKCKNKFDAKMKQDHYLNEQLDINVKFADVFEDDDYIAPCEL